MTTHDRIAGHLARKLGTQRNNGQGPDIRTPDKVVEVEVSPDMLNQGMRQLQGFQVPRYLAVPKTLVPEALTRVEGTKVGVMDADGNVHKKAQAPKKRK